MCTLNTRTEWRKRDNEWVIRIFFVVAAAAAAAFVLTVSELCVPCVWCASVWMLLCNMYSSFNKHFFDFFSCCSYSNGFWRRKTLTSSYFVVVVAAAATCLKYIQRRRRRRRPLNVQKSNKINFVFVFANHHQGGGNKKNRIEVERTSKQTNEWNDRTSHTEMHDHF